MGAALSPCTCSPATMLAAAGVALAAGLSALALERDLPVGIRLTPRPSST